MTMKSDADGAMRRERFGGVAGGIELGYGPASDLGLRWSLTV